MKCKQTELKKGIRLHTIYTDKFKTNLIAIFMTTKLNRENVTKNAVISAILRRGSKNMPTQEEISKQMEEMYGASFDCGLDKTGDNQVLKFYLETINDNYLPQKEEDILNGLDLEEKFSIVVSNPPYVCADEEVSPNTKYEPKMALYPGKDDIIFYKKILNWCTSSTLDKSIIAFEIGATQAEQIVTEAEKSFPNARIVVEKDYNGFDRFVYIFKGIE